MNGLWRGYPPGVMFTILGAPIDSVGLGHDERLGTERSPAAVRAAGLDRLGWRDAGDLDVRIPDHERDAATGLVGAADVLATTDTIRHAIAGLIADGQRPFVLGGCCALLPGALAGARDTLGDIGLVYVDGHLDLYDGMTSPTGEAADMPIAVILGDGPGPWVGRVEPSPVVPIDRIALLGYRDPDELADLGDRLPGLRDAGLFDADAGTIRRDGPAEVGHAALAHVAGTSRSVWLHIDLDVLDEDVFPATDYLLPGGLDWAALIELVNAVSKAPDLVGWSLSCYNPDKDPGGRDGRAIVDAIERLFGP